MIDTGAVRKRILSLAVHGKLTEQLSEDESVESLVQNINIERQNRLGRKYKPVNISEDTSSLDIPCTWAAAPLESIAKSIFAGGDKPADFSKVKTDKQTVPVFSNGIDKNGLFGFTERATVNDECLTISARGTIGFSVVRTEPFVPIVRLLVVIPENGISTAYLKLVMDYYVESGKGSSTQQLTVPMIKGKTIPLPPSAEQQRIVERVESIFSLLDEIDEAQTSFVKNQESLRNKLIETVLFASNYGKITTEEFSKHMDLISGRDLSTSEYNDKGNGIPYYTGASNFDNGRLTVNRWTESPAVISKQGDLLVTCKGTVGKMAYATETAHIARQIMAIRPKDIDVEYAYYFMEYYVATLKKKAKGLIPGIERKDLLAAPFPFREEQEQKRIVDKLNELLPLCS